MNGSDRTIAGYEVLNVLGHGASSTIYAVMDPRDKQVYAVKRVTLNSPTDQRFIDQAVVEHEVASKLDHPVLRKSHRIIRKRKVLRTVELIVLMEFVDGSTLEQHRPQSTQETVVIFLRVAEGLDVMHRAGYVHCDVKPNNIVVGTDGVKIVDFGHACPVNTVKQRIQGTPDYIAPEQVLKRTITPRTDIFNLGATMYWCLTNHHVPTLIPKATNTKAITLGQEKLVPPVQFNPLIPTALNTLILSCLEIDPDYRPASMQEVAERLQLVLLQLTRRPASEKAAEESGIFPLELDETGEHDAILDEDADISELEDSRDP